jgi:hypothetical protein
MLILAQLYKYFNKDDKIKEGFSEIEQEPMAMPTAMAQGQTTTVTVVPSTTTTMKDRAALQGIPAQPPTAALQVSTAKQSADFIKPPEPFLMPLKKDNKVEKATEELKKDVQNNPLTEEVRLKFSELEKLGKEAMAVFK